MVGEREKELEKGDRESQMRRGLGARGGSEGEAVVQHSALNGAGNGGDPWCRGEGREKELETVRHGERALNDVALTRAKTQSLPFPDRSASPADTGVSYMCKYSYLNVFPHRRMCENHPAQPR